MDYYRLNTLNEEFNISLERVRYAIEQRTLLVSRFINKTRIIYGQWSKEGTFVGEGTALYEGVISLYIADALNFLTSGKFETDRFILRQVDNTFFKPIQYPFKLGLPNKYFFDWAENPASRNRSNALHARSYPEEVDSPSRIIGNMFLELSKTYANHKSDEIAKSFSSMPAWSLVFPKIEFKIEDICFLREDLQSAGLLSKGKRDENLLKKMVQQLVREYPAKGGAGLWKLLDHDEWLEMSPFEATNIIVEKDNYSLTWKNQKGKESTITKASFENLVSNIKKNLK